MSLDVYIRDKYYTTKDKIKFDVQYDDIFDCNITHNLNVMAQNVSIDFYYALWRPYLIVNPNHIIGDTEAEYEFEYNSNVYCEDLIPTIEDGLAELKSNPDKYKKFDSPNGWGSYDNFVPWVERYLSKLKEYPNMSVMVSR